jgi:predicted hydrolase (HD superfamily)
MHQSFKRKPSNMVKISTRIRLGFGIVIILVLILGGTAFFSLAKINEGMESMYANNLLPIRYLGEVNRELLTIRGDVYRYTGIKDSAKYAEIEKNITNSFKDLKESMAKFKESGFSSDEQEEIKNFEDDITKYENEILSAIKDREWPEAYIHAVESHGWKLCCDVEPTEKMEKVLYTIDELTGLIAATAILRPSQSLLDLTVKSVKKKWKQKSFAVGVNREVIEAGVEMLGMPLEDVIKETIEGMKPIAAEIGLKDE